MQVRELGASGIDASIVAFGAWAIGGWLWGGTDECEAVKAIQAAIDAGITLIDTAPVYGFGVSERIVGEAIKGRRDEVVVATKCGLVWNTDLGIHHFDSMDNDGNPLKIHRCLRPETIRAEVEQSLTRLGIDYIDLYQTHWQEDTTPIADTMGELLKLKEEGKIRAIGCSNATPDHMDQYRAAGQLDCDQEKYSMLHRPQEKTNLPYSADNNMAFLAYSPIAQGLLTGKVGPERRFPENDLRATSPLFTVENRTKVAAMLKEFEPITNDHGISLAQLAIAWTVHQHGCTHALVGARTPEQAVENAKAGEVALSDDEINMMQDALEHHFNT